MAEPVERTLATLRRKAETALNESRAKWEIDSLLRRILELAAPSSEVAIFAHRNLGELHLEEHPWRAALHLRAVLKTSPNDDGVQALMGLSQALLGNYRAAIASYRRAVRLAPTTPWYRHNLGHLLDVALSRPTEALPHLRAAHEREPDHAEIVASLAHCLQNLGQQEQARLLAARAVKLAPRSKSHRQLLAWIEGEDLPSDDEPLRADPRIGTASDEQVEEVTRLLEGALSGETLARALRLLDNLEGVSSSSSVVAAALHYASCRLAEKKTRVTQAAVAKQYNVSRSALSRCYNVIRDRLALVPNDRRF